MDALDVFTLPLVLVLLLVLQNSTNPDELVEFLDGCVAESTIITKLILPTFRRKQCVRSKRRESVTR